MVAPEQTVQLRGPEVGFEEIAKDLLHARRIASGLPTILELSDWSDPVGHSLAIWLDCLNLDQKAIRSHGTFHRSCHFIRIA